MNNHAGWSKTGRCVYCGTFDPSTNCNTIGGRLENPITAKQFSDFVATFSSSVNVDFRRKRPMKLSPNMRSESK